MGGGLRTSKGRYITAGGQCESGHTHIRAVKKDHHLSPRSLSTQTIFYKKNFWAVSINIGELVQL